MQMPSHADAFQVLLLQAADEGRKDALFGDSWERAYRDGCAFMVGNEFPDVYFEFPLAGDPFLDVTALLKPLEAGTRIDSVAAEGTGPMLDWYAGVRGEYESVSCGFELDTKNPELPAAAIHFQPRTYTELVEPFCEAVGEPERAALYLDTAARMPEGWPLSFFGMFRGRPGFPLRICGYLSDSAKCACAEGAANVAAVFDQVGFSAYDNAMLEGVSQVMRTAHGSLDFQFDVYPDGSLGDTFALDVQFEIERPELVRESFDSGPVSKVMGLFEQWGIADARWRLTSAATFARAIPIRLEDGTRGSFAFTLMPQWAKVRWRAGKLQPAKLYYYAHAGLLDNEDVDNS